MEREGHIRSLRIQNFKCFEDFRMENIGQFNLIVGANNAGKTSLLEALLMVEEWGDTLLFEAYLRRTASLFEKRKNNFDLAAVYRSMDKKNGAISVEFECKVGEVLKHSLNVFDFAEALKDEEIRDFFSEQYGAQGSKMFNDNKKIIISRRGFGTDMPVQRMNTIESIPEEGRHRILPLIGVFDFYHSNLVSDYSESIQNDRDTEREFLVLLDLVTPGVEAVDIYIDVNTQKPTLGLLLKEKQSLIALSMFGDGTQRMFLLLTKLFQLKHSSVLPKTLLIDEVDFGIHKSKLLNFWKVLFELAIRLNIQLFMTTHNVECVKAFWEAFETEEIKSKFGVERDKVARHFILERDKNGIPRSYSLPLSHLGHAIENDNNFMGR